MIVLFTSDILYRDLSEGARNPLRLEKTNRSCIGGLTYVPNKSTFRLSGEQTVRTIAETHRALLAFYGKSAAVAIDPAKVTDADLTLIQLVESVRRAAARDGKKVCMTAHPPESVRDVLVRGGFLNSPANALFWTAP